MFCSIQVRDLYGNRAGAGEVSRGFLRNLPPKNRLRLVVWAECKTDPDHPEVYYGVSLGVRHFVRPLYLHTKLCKLPIVENRPQDVNCLKDVKAFAITEIDTVKQPCGFRYFCHKIIFFNNIRITLSISNKVAWQVTVKRIWQSALEKAEKFEKWQLHKNFKPSVCPICCSSCLPIHDRSDNDILSTHFVYLELSNSCMFS